MLEFAPLTAWTVLEYSPKVHRYLNRTTDFSDSYHFEVLLKEIGEVDTHIDIGTGPQSPCSEIVLNELNVSQSIGIDITDYENEKSGCGHTFSNSVYGEDSNEGNQFVKANGLHIPLDDNEADLVTMGRYLNNIEPCKTDTALSEVQRILETGGYVAGDMKITRFVRPHEMLQRRTIGAQEAKGRILREKYVENWREELNENFENVNSGVSWVDEPNRPYVQTLYFVGENV